MIRARVLASAFCVALVAGCANQGEKPNSQVQKDTAKKQWASARANVMGNMAKEQYENGNFEKCRTSLDEALKMDPESAPLRILSARLSIEQGNLELAEKELVQARRFEPSNAEADYLSGVVCQRWQRGQEAYEFYRSAAEKQPSELAYLLAQSEMLVGLNRADDALKLLQDKVVYFEYSATIRDAVGQIFMQKGKYPQAAESFRQASILATDDNVVREHLGLAYFRAKQYREAAEVFARLTKDEKYLKRGDIYLALAECHLQENKAREAREAFEMATQLSPNSAAAYMGLGKAALQLGDLRRSEIAIKKTITLEPASSEAHLLMGYIRLKQNKVDEALASFRKSNALDANDTVSLCMVGYAYEKQGKNSEALQCYSKALKIKPGDELATRLMAEVQLDQ